MQYLNLKIRDHNNLSEWDMLPLGQCRVAFVGVLWDTRAILHNWSGTRVLSCKLKTIFLSNFFFFFRCHNCYMLYPISTTSPFILYDVDHNLLKGLNHLNNGLTKTACNNLVSFHLSEYYNLDLLICRSFWSIFAYVGFLFYSGVGRLSCISCVSVCLSLLCCYAFSYSLIHIFLVKFD